MTKKDRLINNEEGKKTYLYAVLKYKSPRDVLSIVQKPPKEHKFSADLRPVNNDKHVRIVCDWPLPFIAGWYRVAIWLV